MTRMFNDQGEEFIDIYSYKHLARQNLELEKELSRSKREAHMWRTSFTKEKNIKITIYAIAEATASFYANKGMWRIGGGTNEIPMFNKFCESSIDSEWFPEESRHVSGGVARRGLERMNELFDPLKREDDNGTL